MKKQIFLLTTVLFLVTSSCTNRVNIPNGGVAIAVEREWSFVGFNPGVTVWKKSLEPGRRAVGIGPSTTYFVNGTTQQYQVPIEVFMKDQIFQTFELIIGYNIKTEGEIPYLLVNNLIPDSLIEVSSGDPYKELHSSNQNTAVTFHPDQLFENIIFPTAEMTGEDESEEYFTLETNAEELQERVKDSLIVRLGRIKLPIPVRVDDKGQPYLCTDSCTMSPLDFITIQTVLVKGISIPDDLVASITEQNRLKAELKTLETTIEGLDVEQRIATATAHTAAEMNRNTLELYEKEPHARIYQRIRKLREALATNHLSKVTLRVRPKGSKAADN